MKFCILDTSEAIEKIDEVYVKKSYNPTLALPHMIFIQKGRVVNLVEECLHSYQNQIFIGFVNRMLTSELGIIVEAVDYSAHVCHEDILKAIEDGEVSGNTVKLIKIKEFLKTDCFSKRLNDVRVYNSKVLSEDVLSAVNEFMEMKPCAKILSTSFAPPMVYNTPGFVTITYKV